VVKVLVADDNVLTTSLLETLFEMEGFDVVSVNDGRDVVSTVQEHQPTVVLMDYHLGSLEGTTLIRQIRELASVADVPIVVFSGLDKAPEALAAGADRFVDKPFEPEELVEVINELV
jgi:DNA-binding response OmpR family regulator